MTGPLDGFIFEAIEAKLGNGEERDWWKRCITLMRADDGFRKVVKHQSHLSNASSTLPGISAPTALALGPKPNDKCRQACQVAM